MTKKCDAVQENVLSEIIAQNAGNNGTLTEQLTGKLLSQKFRSSPVKTSSLTSNVSLTETFKSKVPFITYKDLQPYIKRITNGDRSPILSSHPISELLTRYVAGLDKGKGLYLFFIKAETETPSGLVARPVLTSYYKSQ